MYILLYMAHDESMKTCAWQAVYVYQLHACGGICFMDIFHVESVQQISELVIMIWFYSSLKGWFGVLRLCQDY